MFEKTFDMTYRQTQLDTYATLGKKKKLNCHDSKLLT